MNNVFENKILIDDNHLNVDLIVNQITTNWMKATSIMMDVAVTLNNLQQDRDNYQVWKKVRQRLIDKKIMSKVVISNLCQIAQSNFLITHVEQLPPAYTTLWELSKLPEIELQNKLDDGLINPTLRLERVREWINVDTTNVITDFDTVFVEKEEDLFKKSIIINLSDDFIIHNYENVEDIIEKIKVLLPEATVECYGLLRKKILGD